MANALVKISQLSNIGNNLSVNTLIPVVDTSGNYITDKTTVGSVANFILNEAGNILPEAFVSTLSYNVINAAQPNITSVGTLTGLTVSNLANFHLPSGVNGYVLQTNGNGNLNWTAMAGSGNGNPGGANTQIQFNDSGLFAGDSNLTYDKNTDTLNTINIELVANLYADYAELTHDLTANVVIANYLYGDGSNITNVSVNSTAYANLANFVVVEEVNNNYSYHVVLTTGANDYSLHNDSDDNFQYNPQEGTLTVTRVDTQYLQVGNVISNITPWLDVTYNIGNATNRFNDIYLANSTIYLGNATISSNGNSIVVDSISISNGNVGTIGNIASINLNGNGSQVLAGNGTWVAQSGGGNASLPLANGNSNINIASANGPVTLTSAGQIWQFNIDGNLVLPGNTFAVNYANGTQVPLGGGNANIGNFVFANTTMSTVDEDVMYIQTTDNNSNLRTQMSFDPNVGRARMSARSAENNTNYTNTSWTIGEYTSQQVNFVDAPAVIAFLNTGAWGNGVNKSFSINGGNRLTYDGYSAGGNNATIYTNVTADPDPTIVTSIDFYYQLESYFEIYEDDGSTGIYATGLTIRIDNDQTEGPDIFIRSGDDITMQGKDMSLGSEREGGDINIYAGDGSGDDGAGNSSSSGGDIQIFSGVGGDGNTGSGSQGGTLRLRAGEGGVSGVTNVAGQGGFVEVWAGSGGPNNGNTNLGATGGYVDIQAGDTNLEGTNGGNVSIRSGAGGANAIAGNVEIVIPSSGLGGGGTWTFDGNGLLTLPGGYTKIGAQYGSDAILSSNVSFGVATQGNATTYMNWSDDVANTSVMAAIYVNAPNATPGDIHIRTGGIGNANVWQFNVDGNLVLPNGNSVIYSIANSSLDPTLPNVSTMTLTPDANYNSQVLVLDPTAPGHIHLRAHAFSNIDDPAANIFLGGEQTAFEVTQGANNVARIHSGNLTWTFSNNSGASVIDLPGESVLSSNNDTITIQSYDTANGIGRGIYIGTNGGLYFWDGNSQSVSLQQDNTNANLTSIGNVSITSNVSTWTLDTAGISTFPVVTYASLSSATTPGKRAFISDANLVALGNFGATVGGGGSNTVPVYSDGSNWCIG